MCTSGPNGPSGRSEVSARTNGVQMTDRGRAVAAQRDPGERTTKGREWARRRNSNTDVAAFREVRDVKQQSAGKQ